MGKDVIRILKPKTQQRYDQVYILKNETGDADGTTGPEAPDRPGRETGVGCPVV
jgi:hypothetical protein